MHRVQVLEVKSFGFCTGALRPWVDGGKSFGFASGFGVTSLGDKVHNLCSRVVDQDGSN